MYPVSDAYLAARRSRVREERITGGIKLKDGTIIAIDDSVIIQNSLSISKKVCSSSKFDIGTMNCSVLEMKLVDDSAYDHEFGGALIRLKYGIVTGVDEDGNKVWEEVPLPPFFADGSEVTRKWNVITITAYDPISLLNIDYPDTIPTDSLYSALQYVCNRAGIGLAITEDEFSLLPNSSVKPDFSSAQVVSCLDVAMWIAQTVNCCGFVDHRGLLYLKQYNYAGGNNYDRLFTEDEIKDIKYSDTRTYLAYLQAYAGDKVKLYSKVTTWTGSDASHTKEGALSLPKNPILSGLTDEEQAAVNSSYLENRSYPTRYIKMTGWVDPALELMDVVAFSGKMIDVGQIINVATQIKWCYGKSGTIYCASVAERSETAEEASSAAVMTLAVTEEETSDFVNRVQPKSQIEKELDELRGKLNSGSVAEKLVDSSGYASLKNAYIDYKSKNMGFFDPAGNKLGEFCVRDGYFMLVWGGKEVVTFEECGDISIQSMDGTKVKLTTTGNAEILEVKSAVYTGAYLSVTINNDRTGSIRIGSGLLSGNTLSFQSDGLYYNGKKVLTEE